MHPGISKKEADAYDRMLDAAALLAELTASSGLEIDDCKLEELSIFLAKNAHIVREILKKCRMSEKKKI
ncbi:MAG: YebG family protein [Desulfobacterales bacterium]